jgi:hypothetical protein
MPSVKWQETQGTPEWKLRESTMPLAPFPQNMARCVWQEPHSSPDSMTSIPCPLFAGLWQARQETLWKLAPALLASLFFELWQPSHFVAAGSFGDQRHPTLCLFQHDKADMSESCCGRELSSVHPP